MPEFNKDVPIYFTDKYKDIKYNQRTDDQAQPVKVLSHQQILDSSEKNINLAGWRIFFTEEDVSARRTRKENDPLQTFRASRKYDDIVSDLKLQPYLLGLSAEDELALYLEGELDDGASRLLAIHFIGGRPFVFWNRERGYLYFGWSAPGNAYGTLGVVPSVSIT